MRPGGSRGLVAALSVAACAWACGRGQAPAPTVEVRQGDFERAITVQGALAAAETLVIRPGAWGKISFLLPEGTVVEEGEALFGLETADMEANLEQARLDLAVAEANLGKALEDARIQRIKDDLAVREKTAALELARIRQSDAREDLERKRRQVEAQILARRELTEARRQLRQAELNLENAGIDLERLREEIASRAETSQLERRSAEARVEKESSEVREAEDYLAKAVAVAPRGGIVIHARRGRRVPAVGDQVGPQNPVIELPDLGRLEVQADVHEVDVGAVRAGMPARIRVEAFPTEVMQGRVAEVSGLAKELQDDDGRSTGVRVFEVVVELDRQDERLRPGMTCRVSIVLDRREDVILVPLAAVRGSGEEATVVLASGRECAIRVVASNLDEAVVAEGLEPGDRVRVAGWEPAGDQAASGPEGDAT